MQSWKKLVLGAIVIVALGGGAIVASASTTTPSNVRYSACLSPGTGTLSKVTSGATPKCEAGSRVIAWNEQGVKGAAGATGVAGTRGSLWSTGTTAPTVISGQQAGDFYLDTTTGNVYEVIAGSWTVSGSLVGLRGPAGAAGTPGVAGARGSLWSTGASAPSVISGQQAGDLYLDTANNNVYELVAGTWTLEDNIQGAAGSSYNCSAGLYPGIDMDGCALGGAHYFDLNVPGAQFAGANLGSSFLYGGSNFDDANFSGATMTSSYLYNSATFQNANFSGANLASSYLYTGGDFTNANFTGANLTNANLYNGGIFTNANFSNANLTGANIVGGTFTNAIWNDTTCPGGTNSSIYTPQTCVGH